MTTALRTTVSPKRRRKSARPEPVTKQVGIRASLDWADWLDRAATHCRTDVAKLIDAAVIDYVRQRGFDEPAPPRL
jgi:hypothetical protein